MHKYCFSSFPCGALLDESFAFIAFNFLILYCLVDFVGFLLFLFGFRFCFFFSLFLFFVFSFVNFFSFFIVVLVCLKLSIQTFYKKESFPLVLRAKRSSFTLLSNSVQTCNIIYNYHYTLFCYYIIITM